MAETAQGLLERLRTILRDLFGRTLPAGEGNVAGTVRAFVLGYPLLALSMLVGVVILAGASAVAVLTGRGPFGTSTTPDAAPVGSSTSGGTIPATETDEATESGRIVETLLARAREQVANGATNAGVITAYVAVRRRLADRSTSGRGFTHWEFYRRRRDGLDEESSGSLRALTEAFERAAFTAESLPSEDARESLERASSFGDRSDRSAD